MKKFSYARLPLAGKILAPLLSVFLGSWTIGTVSVGYLATRGQANELSRETQNAAFQITKEIGTAQEILSFKAKSLTDIELLAQAVSDQDHQTLLRILLPLKSSLALDWVKVIDQQGAVLADLRSSTVGSAQLKDTEIIEFAQKKLFVTSLVISEDNTPLLIKTLSVNSRQRDVGGLIVGFALTPEILDTILGAGRQEIVLLKGSEVVTATLPITHPVTWPTNPLTGQTLPKTIDPSQNGQPVQIDGTTYLSWPIELSQIADDQIQAIVLTPLTEFHTSQRQLWLLVCSASLVSGLMVSAIGLWVARLISRRIAKLIEATQTLAAGDLSHRIPIDGSDEVATLATGFNHMAEQLKQRDLEIKAQLEELERLVGELQQLPERVHTERMAGLGQMVAGIAHEINNPVSFIYSNVPPAKEYVQDLLNLLRLYQQYVPEPPVQIREEQACMDVDFVAEDLPKLLESMASGAERIREIVLSLRNFSRKDEATMKRVNIHDGLDSTLVILEHRLKDQGDRLPIQVIKEYGTLPNIDCFAGEVNQVFMNVLANAIDEFEVETAHTKTDSQEGPRSRCPQIRIKTEVLDTSWISIRISDNGSGIPDDIRRQLFDPFFTTKKVGQGTGLGLSISYQIVVAKHGGKISCESEPGQGTTFIIQLPVTTIVRQTTSPTALPDSLTEPAFNFR